MTIRQLDADAYTAALPALGRLLADTVAAGASLGFVHPFDAPAAQAWWADLSPAVAAGSLRVWGAHDGTGDLVGTISLALPSKPNARHRAEIVKLMVHPRARGRGLARTLLDTAEAAARGADVSLLVLDTETDSPADRLYAATGWTRYGLVPAYAASPDGTLKDCSFYYKQLRTQSG
ncbi:GNAT family N-acetyltransferase [Streptacidiphilus monticola]|jgi:ribosomal protein S18 acetylase RimI-like enzyme|uniref:GNAT family N-acetyltransferase n=1 Tax=Streptacidiphilus monticola TaxID=2161674 RepID=A0ABW1FXN6_9ACTN